MGARRPRSKPPCEFRLRSSTPAKRRFRGCAPRKQRGEVRGSRGWRGGSCRRASSRRISARSFVPGRKLPSKLGRGKLVADRCLGASRGNRSSAGARPRFCFVIRAFRAAFVALPFRDLLCLCKSEARRDGHRSAA